MRETADIYNVKIHIKNDNEIVPPRENNTCFMTLVMKSSKFKYQEKWNINEIRKHLNIMYLSDIVTIDGKRIGKHVIKGNVRSSTLNWPRAFPNAYWKAKWKNCINLMTKKSIKYYQ